MDFFNEHENEKNNHFENKNDCTEKELFQMLRELIDEIKDENNSNDNNETSDSSEDKSKDVCVPIKDIIHNEMKKYGASYGEYSVIILRQYYIALLNLGFIQLEELESMVDKFVSKIDAINYCEITPSFYGGGVEIKDRIMYINTELSDGVTDENYEEISVMIDNGIFDEEFDEADIDNIDEFENFKFEIEFYKAITAVITDLLNLENKGVTYIVDEMIAEKVWSMNKKKTRIMMPKSYNENVGSTTITTRTGYLRCNVPISLFKQFCIAYKINEYVFFRSMLHSGFKNAIDEICNGEMKFFLFLLDKYFSMYASRVVYNKPVQSELNLIENFQSQLNKKLKNVDNYYFDFLALVTTDDLRARLVIDKGELFD